MVITIDLDALTITHKVENYATALYLDFMENANVKRSITTPTDHVGMFQDLDTFQLWKLYENLTGHKTKEQGSALYLLLLNAINAYPVTDVDDKEVELKALSLPWNNTKVIPYVKGVW